MALFLLSLAGIPPTAGFIAKVRVFAAAIAAGNWPLVLVGVLASVVAAFFYLRVIVLMYMRSRTDRAPEPVDLVGRSPCGARGADPAAGVVPSVLLNVLTGVALLGRRS